MKIFVFALATGLLAVQSVHAFDIRVIANNKEAVSRAMERITFEELNEFDAWLINTSLTEEQLKEKSKAVLANAMNVFEKWEGQCDLGLATLLKNEATKNSLISKDEELKYLLIFMRKQNLVDDLLFKLMLDSSDVNFAIKKAEKKGSPLRPLNLHTDLNAGVNLEKVYANFKTYPDEVNKCSLDEFAIIANAVKTKSSRELSKLNFLALRKNLISLSTYHRLETIRRKKVLDWNLSTEGYFEVVRNAKDKLSKNLEASTDNKFNQRLVNKKKQLTERGYIYSNFDSTQVMMLSGVLEKAAKRMDAKEVTLNFRFTNDPNSETETYIFSPMEQYRAAINMLKKDIAELRRSEVMGGKSISFEDVITSAFETGFIKSEELNYVIAFEELWNPQVPGWRSYANFAFNLVGTATFYLPAPYNVLGAIALIITESKIMKKPEADSEDSWNTII